MDPDSIPLSYLSISLAVLLLLSAFFSGSETALMALNRYRMRHRAAQGHRGARRAQALLNKPDRLIGIILLGNNLVNFVAASLATVIAIRLAGDNGPWIAPFVLTPLVLIFAEVAPKTWAANRPETLAYLASAPLQVLLKLCYPIVALINGIANLLLRPFRLHTHDRSDHLSRDELRTLLSTGGVRPEGYRNMVLNILDLESATVEDIMVPRSDMMCLDLADDWHRVVAQISKSFYTRLPVYEGDMEHIVGILHVRTVIGRLVSGRLDKVALRRAVRKPYFIPETTSLTQQLLQFQDRERRIGLVVDEYGDIQGLVTLDDILEEIVGEFTTEPKPRARQISTGKDGALVVDGAEHIRILNRRLGWDLPTEGARTLNGLILEQLETIPEAGTQVMIEDLAMTITEIQDNVIKQVEVRALEESDSALPGS